MASESGTLSGWLEKTGESSKSFQKRYFIIVGDVLEYRKDVKGKARGSIPLEDINLVEPDERSSDPNVFNIVTRDRRYNVRGKTQQERDFWVRRLGAEVAKVQEQHRKRVDARKFASPSATSKFAQMRKMFEERNNTSDASEPAKPRPKPSRSVLQGTPAGVRASAFVSNPAPLLDPEEAASVKRSSVVSEPGEGTSQKLIEDTVTFETDEAVTTIPRQSLGNIAEEAPDVTEEIKQDLSREQQRGSVLDRLPPAQQGPADEADRSKRLEEREKLLHNLQAKFAPRAAVEERHRERRKKAELERIERDRSRRENGELESQNASAHTTSTAQLSSDDELALRPETPPIDENAPVPDASAAAAAFEAKMAALRSRGAHRGSETVEHVEPQRTTARVSSASATPSLAQSNSAGGSPAAAQIVGVPAGNADAHAGDTRRRSSGGDSASYARGQPVEDPVAFPERRPSDTEASPVLANSRKKLHKFMDSVKAKTKSLSDRFEKMVNIGDESSVLALLMNAFEHRIAQLQALHPLPAEGTHMSHVPVAKDEDVAMWVAGAILAILQLSFTSRQRFLCVYDVFRQCEDANTLAPHPLTEEIRKRTADLLGDDASIPMQNHFQNMVFIFLSLRDGQLRPWINLVLQKHYAPVVQDLYQPGALLRSPSELTRFVDLLRILEWYSFSFSCSHETLTAHFDHWAKLNIRDYLRWTYNLPEDVDPASPELVEQLTSLRVRVAPAPTRSAAEDSTQPLLDELREAVEALRAYCVDARENATEIQAQRLIRGRLSTAIAKILMHRFKAKRLVGKYHVWDFIQAASSEIASGPDRMADMEFAMQNINQTHSDPNMKLRSLVVASIVAGQLAAWLGALATARGSVSRFYFPDAAVLRHIVDIEETLTAVERPQTNLNLKFELQRATKRA